MISYIKGTVEEINPSSVVVESNGIGFFLNVTAKTVSGLSLHEPAKILTYVHFCDNGASFFGFVSKDEQNMFERLLTVSGVGPKAALALLSILTPDEISLAVTTDDFLTLSKAPGVGKKTAQRITLELKDKVDSAIITPQQSISIKSGAKQDAADALLALGYGRGEALKAILEVAIEGMDAEQIIKLALKKLAVI